MNDSAHFLKQRPVKFSIFKNFVQILNYFQGKYEDSTVIIQNVDWFEMFRGSF